MQIKKKNNLKLMIWYCIPIIALIGVVGILVYLKNNSNPKIYPIPDTTTEVKEEYFEGYQIHDSNKISKKHPIPSNEKPYLGADGKTWYLYKNSAETLQGTPMIKITYTFHGLNGLGKGQHQADEPTDLAPFMKNPFDKWINNFIAWDAFGNLILKAKGYEESHFGYGISRNRENYTITINYRGPKWFIEEDKDFYVGESGFKVLDPKKGEIALSDDMKTYYLHFNPVKQYLTLYTKKFNTKPTAEAYS